MTIRVAIVDDQALMRDGFSMILDAQPDIDVVGAAENGRLGVELCLRTRPDVVLMDVRMPVLDGIEATRLITSSEDCATRVLVLTTFDRNEYVYAARYLPRWLYVPDLAMPALLAAGLPPHAAIVGVTYTSPA